MAINIGDAILYFRGDTSGLESAIGQAQSRTQSAFSGIGSTISAAAIPLAAFGAGATAALASTIAPAVEFNKQIGLLGALGVENLPKMTKEIMATAEQLHVLPTEIADATKFIISYGVAAKDAMGIATIATKLAVAGETDVTTAFKAAAQTINGYGMDMSKDFASVSDKVALTAKLSSTTVAEIAQSIGMTASTAKAAGIPLESYYATCAALSNVFPTASMGINALKMAINDIVSPTDKAAGAAADMGIKFNYAALQTKDWPTFWKDLKEELQHVPSMHDQMANSMKRMDDQIKAGKPLTADQIKQYKEIQRNIAGASTETISLVEATNMLFGSETGKQAALAIMGGQIENIIEFTKKLKEETGEVNKEYDAFRKNGGQAFTDMKTAIGTLAIQVGNALLPAFKYASEAVGWIAKAFKGLNDAGILQFAVPIVAGLAGIATAASMAIFMFTPLINVIKGFRASSKDMATGTKEQSAATDGLRSGLAQLKNEISKAEQEQKQYNATIDKSTGDIVRHGAQLQKEEGQLQQTRSRVGQLGDQITALNNDYAKSEAQVAKYNASTTKLEAEIMQLTNACMKGEISENKFDAALTKASASIDKNVLSISKLESNMASLKTKISETEAKLDSTSASAIKTEAAITGLKDKIHQAGNDFAQASTEIVGTEYKLEKLQIAAKETGLAIEQMGNKASSSHPHITKTGESVKTLSTHSHSATGKLMDAGGLIASLSSLTGICPEVASGLMDIVGGLSDAEGLFGKTGGAAEKTATTLAGSVAKWGLIAGAIAGTGYALYELNELLRDVDKSNNNLDKSNLSVETTLARLEVRAKAAGISLLEHGYTSLDTGHKVDYLVGKLNAATVATEKKTAVTKIDAAESVKASETRIEQIKKEEGIEATYWIRRGEAWESSSGRVVTALLNVTKHQRLYAMSEEEASKKLAQLLEWMDKAGIHYDREVISHKTCIESLGYLIEQRQNDINKMNDEISSAQGIGTALINQSSDAWVSALYTKMAESTKAGAINITTNATNKGTEALKQSQAQAEKTLTLWERFVNFAGSVVDASGAMPIPMGSYATGGPVQRTGLSLVGERGPELVQLQQGSYVHNATETQRMLSQAAQSNNTTVSITFPGMVINKDVDVDKFLAKLQDKLQNTLARRGVQLTPARA